MPKPGLSSPRRSPPVNAELPMPLGLAPTPGSATQTDAAAQIAELPQQKVWLWLGLLPERREALWE